MTRAKLGASRAGIFLVSNLKTILPRQLLEVAKRTGVLPF